MFTGIIQEKVAIEDIKWSADGQACVFCIRSSHSARRSWKLGDSIALDGTCLTIVQVEHNEHATPPFTRLAFDVSKETLSKTHWAKSLEAKGARMNSVHLEPALRMGEPFGGHVVSGHVEDVAQLESKKPEGDYLSFTFSVARSSSVSGFLVSKGSIAIDGVSLTVNEVWDEPGKTFFNVYLIPHTVEKCHFALLEKGSLVNVESDLMARHYCRLKEHSEQQSIAQFPREFYKGEKAWL